MDFSRTRLSLDRPIASYTKVQVAYSWLVRNRRIWTNRRAERLGLRYLNAGCGPNIVDGFLNLDYLWHPGVHLCWDLTKRLPLASASMKGIFTEHCLEHIPRRLVGDVLVEFRRVLEPGGCLRVVVPDAELYLDLYRRRKAGEQVTFPYEVSTPSQALTPIEAVNAVFRDHGHEWAYDFAGLEQDLFAAGFTEVHRCSFRKGNSSMKALDSERRAVESLYVEAKASA